MSLFNQILNAIDNPNQQANPSQLASIVSTVQQLSNNANTDASTIQSVLSVVGKYARPALQQKRQADGEQQTQSFVNQYSGTQPSTQAVESLFSMPQIQQLVQEAAQRTGLNAGMIQSMLPILVPLVLNFLQTGADAQNPQGSNSVLSSFLDSDQDGDVDISDAMKLASRYLNP
ncbi:MULTISPECIES: DUF937 domain-containing protein [unclassified Coleofasciculus]|uniref:DUF937 domain-containing protein n=1 Tax=unclassified Coleofasciculus TaxID=2692782 RepID=UPI00187ED68B|nr:MULTISPECIES: DUF937 domain-containing protein [unclassified Coleofasciculus]MBE9127577.1 DUF937 domain-containing protein [Coleofasciculus sp. LEGE 07081]MBE9149792.1 DUF937 domain-containing protein [Coleofasciculus sp. LEGE 07092]